jgi:hypothetical protein
MKCTKTLVLAASILALTLSAFPHIALAGTTTAALHADPDLTRQGGGKGVKYMAVILAAGNLISLLVS